MDTIQKMQNFRTQLIQEINVTFDRMIQELRETQEQDVDAAGTTNNPVVREYESLYPLTAATGMFKGRKPTGVRFPDGTRIDVPTWKKVVEVIMKQCNSVPEKHNALMGIRGKASGRDRVFLGEDPEKMRSPLKIDEGLYIETHYDTETLLRIMIKRILEAVQYDYSGIAITIRNDN